MALERQDIPEYLNQTALIVLSTVGPHGGPVIRTLASFAADGFDIYFATSRRSDKVGQIGANPQVAILFQHDGQALASFRNVEIRGRAEVIANDTERGRAIAAIAARNHRFKERAEKGELADSALLRVTAHTVKVVDLSRGRGSNNVSFIEL